MQQLPLDTYRTDYSICSLTCAWSFWFSLMSWEISWP